MQDLRDLTPTDIKAFRASQGASQAGLADLLGISVAGVQKWELQGAPHYWRYVFAAIAEKVKPWASTAADKVEAICNGEPGRYEVSIEEAGSPWLYDKLRTEAQTALNRMTSGKGSYEEGNSPTLSFVVEIKT
jgi:transcriptional regulator with XRE-family HTH domain